MEYFVTGATGLIGSHVVHQLVEDGHEVVALTRSASKADHLPEEITIVEGDLTEKDSMREGMRGVDGVFHIAAWAYLGPGPDNVDTAQRVNVEGSRNVFELVDELAIRRPCTPVQSGSTPDSTPRSSTNPPSESVLPSRCISGQSGRLTATSHGR
jgi:nucleoside-diphosphate-sugar epimerase